MRLIALAIVALLPFRAVAAQPDDVRLLVRREDSVAVVAQGERRFLLESGVRHVLDIENRGDQRRNVRIWSVRDGLTEEIFRERIGPHVMRWNIETLATGTGTGVLRVEWDDFPVRGDVIPRLESATSQVYFFITQARDGVAPDSVHGADGMQPTRALEEAFDSAAVARKEALNALRESRGIIGNYEMVTPNYRAIRIALGAMYERGTALVMYAPSGDALTTWVIAADGSLHRHVNPAFRQQRDVLNTLRSSIGVERLQAARSPVIRGLEPRALGRPVMSADRAMAATADLLLPRALASALAGATHLVIVPALELGTIPFAALPHPSGGMIVDHASVAIAASISDVVQPRHRVEFGALARAPLVVGNPAFSPDGNVAWPALPGAEREAAAVARLFGSTALSGAQATRTRVAADMPTASVLYIATHGVADAYDPLRGSFLQFAGNGDDGRLTARAIQESKITARLAVLSACQTGLGGTHDGGVIGVARAFLIAGASQVVMSLWSVNDSATTALMTSFVSRLREQSPPEALRRAMLEVRDAQGARRRPADWASFAVLGTTW